ncbi:MAG: Do family serine endopeptidase [bacterium]
MNNLLNKFGKAQTVLLIIIILIIGGLVGGALVYISVMKGANGSPTIIQQPKLILGPNSTLPTLAPIAAAVKPAVVNIHTEQTIRAPLRGMQRDPFLDQFFGEDFFRRFFQDQGRDSKVTSLGSGVIVDPAGYIITNNHVIDKAEKISVRLADGTVYKNAEIVGRDQKTDIAVIKITRVGAGFPTAKLGDSSELNVGDYVLAIGSPFELNETVTHGIVSALGRKGFRIADYEDFIQTDAPINPGNSGGPLVNMKGEIVGINTFIVTQGAQQSAGVGFSIPSNIVRKVYIDIKSKGKVVRGYLGVGLQDLTPELAKHFGVSNGVLITNVMENSPAAKAGIKVEDIVTSFDGKKVKNGTELRDLVGNTTVGKKVDIQLTRNKQNVTIIAVIAEMPAELPVSQSEGNQSEVDKLGLTVKNVTQDIARQLRLRKVTGVVITDINSDSPASDVMQPGDVILKVNDTNIANTSDYQHAIAQVKKGDTVVFRVYRDGGIVYVSIQLE